MSLTFLGWLFVVSSIPILLLFLMGARGLRKEQPDWENCKAYLEDIGARLKNGELTDAEADAARLALLSRLPSPRWGFSKNIQGYPLKLLVASVVFLLVSGIGAAVSYDRSAPEAIRPEETISFSEPDGEMLTRLTDYARSIGSGQPSSMAAAGELLPDVNAMIERLAARLQTTPQDLKDGECLVGPISTRSTMNKQLQPLGELWSLIQVPPNSSSHTKRPRRKPPKMRTRRQPRLCKPRLRRTKRRENYHARSDARARRCNPLDGRWPGKSPGEFPARCLRLDSPDALARCAWRGRDGGNMRSARRVRSSSTTRLHRAS